MNIHTREAVEILAVKAKATLKGAALQARLADLRVLWLASPAAGVCEHQTFAAGSGRKVLVWSVQDECVRPACGGHGREWTASNGW